MKLPEISKRDIKAFFLGVLFIMLIEMIYDWKEVKRDFNEGWKAARESSHAEGRSPGD
jgi:hypothetical protein